MSVRLAARCRLPAGIGAILALIATLGLAAPSAEALPPDLKARAPAAPAGSVRFTRSYGGTPVDTRRLVVWAGVEEPYLVDIAPGCTDLRKARISSLSTHDRRLVPRLDNLTVEGRACPIERIQPATGSTLMGLGLRREDARPLPIVPQVSTPSSRKTP